MRTLCASAVLLLSAGFATAALQPVAKELDVVPSGGRKAGMTKDELGMVTGTRTISGVLDTSDVSLDDGSRAEVHRLSLRRGAEISIRMRSDEFDPYLLLVRSTAAGFETVAENDDAFRGTLNAAIQFTAESAGEYAIIANGAFSADMGRYEIEVTVDTPGDSSPFDTAGSGSTELEDGHYRGTLRPGEDATLDDGSLFEIVTFNGRRGEVIEAEAASDAFDTVLAISYAARSGGIETLATNDDIGSHTTNSRLRVELPYSGTYAAIVNAFAASEQGEFSLTIRRVEDAQTSMPTPDWDELYPGGGDPNDRYAMLVGIDDYPGERSDLASCVIDTREMRRVLVDQFGFPDENIIVINDADGTREHVIEAFRRHLAQAGPGGTAFFYFSGHGLQLEDDYGTKDESDSRDEAIFLWGPTDRSSILIDEEIGTLVSELRAGRRLVVLDSCHAGTGTLGPSDKYVSLKDPWVRDTLHMPEKFIEGTGVGSSHDLIEGPDDHLLLAACRSDQTASAGTNGNPSVFTDMLLREMEAGGSGQTFGELLSRVQSGIHQLYVEVMKRDPGDAQIPQIEGVKPEWRLAFVLGSHGGE